MALPWSSVDLATGYRGSPRVSTARATAFHYTWRFHGKHHGCGHDTCRGSVRGNLRGTRHGNPRKYHGNYNGIFHGHLYVNCRGNPRQSMANATAFHGNCHGNFHGRQSTAISTDNHGVCRPSAAIAKAIPHSTVISTAIFTGGNLRQLPRLITAFCLDYHGNFRCS